MRVARPKSRKRMSTLQSCKKRVACHSVLHWLRLPPRAASFASSVHLCSSALELSQRSPARRGADRRAMPDKAPPTLGDRILLFKHENLALLLRGQKVFDARKVNYRPGRYLLGCNGRIYAVATLHRAMAVESQRTWDRLRSQHRSVEKTLPYNPKTFLFRVIVRRELAEPLAFRHPHGAVNVVVFRP